MTKSIVIRSELRVAIFHACSTSPLAYYSLLDQHPTLSMYTEYIYEIFFVGAYLYSRASIKCSKNRGRHVGVGLVSINKGRMVMALHAFQAK